MPTYNHQHYISIAIESALSQKCSFPFRLIIGDDNSQDDTRRICQSYSHKYQRNTVLISHPTNIGIAANYRTLFSISDAKYIAILEGDDYWIDDFKLEKQVSALESNPEIGLVHSNYFTLLSNGKLLKGHVGVRLNTLSGNVIGPNEIARININPLTTCFRSCLVKENVNFNFLVDNQLLTVDIFLWAEICRRSKVLYFNETTGIYRVHSNSITGNKSISAIERFNQTSLLMVNYLMDKYLTPENIKQQFRSQHKLELINQYLLANERQKARAELVNVMVIRTFRDRAIYYAARYRFMNIIWLILQQIRLIGSYFKQKISKIIT